MSEIEKCKKCGQNFNIYITGEYPCPDCGIPIMHDETPEDISDTRERSNLYFGILKIIKKLKLEHIDKDQYDHLSIECELEQFYKYNLQQQNKELRNLMLEMADYLNRNKLNYIGSGSIFNQQMNDILNKLK